MARHTQYRPSKGNASSTGGRVPSATPPDPTAATRIADPSLTSPSERWNHPAVVGAVVTVGAVIGAVAYAGSGAAAVLYSLLLDGGIVVGWLAAAAGWGVWPMAWLLGGRRVREHHDGVGGRESDPETSRSANGQGGGTLSLLASVTAVAGGLGIMGLLVLAAGLAGALGFGTSVGLLVGGWVLGGVRLVRLRNHRPTTGASAAPVGIDFANVRVASDDALIAPPSDAGFATWRWLWLLAAAPLAAALAAAMMPPGMLWKPEEPHGFDATAYHLQVPREWFEAGRIVPLHHNVFSYFPFGVEVHYLLAMHLKGGPWDAMYLAQLMHVAMTALAVAAAYAVARQLTRDRRVATVAAVALATVPFLAQLSPLAFNEGGLLLYGTLAVGWALVGVRAARHRLDGGTTNGGAEVTASPTSSLISPEQAEPEPAASSVRSSFGPHPSLFASFLLGGVMAGFACGVKLTGVPLFLVAVPVAAFAVLVRRSPRVALGAAATFLVAGSVVFAPWLVRTAAWSGNPVFPEGTALLGQAHFTDVQVERWKRAHSPQPAQQSVAARFMALGEQVVGNWQFGYLLLPVGVVAMALAWRRAEARMLVLLLAAQAAFWLGMTHLQGRFFVPALPLASAAIALAPWGRLTPGRRAASAAPVLLALLVGGAALWGWWGVHGRLWGVFTGLRSDNGLDARSAILAAENIDWLERDFWDAFPKNDPTATATLVGDAQVFWYTLPMSRLRYRTPFDVPQGPDAFVTEGYGVNGRGPKTWLRVAPSEVERFVRTYQPFPPGAGGGSSVAAMVGRRGGPVRPAARGGGPEMELGTFPRVASRLIWCRRKRRRTGERAR